MSGMMWSRLIATQFTLTFCLISLPQGSAFPVQFYVRFVTKLITLHINLHFACKELRAELIITSDTSDIHASVKCV